MAKVAFIGAGSFVFTRALFRDLMTFQELEGATVALMDIDGEKLDFARRSCDRIRKEGNYNVNLVATKNRRAALKDADAVIITILAGSVDVWQHDLLIPKKFGVDTNVGDTRGPSGIFRAFRTIPVIQEIVRDIERYCPNAIVLNYTNPMAMLCRAIQRTSPVKFTGLCHSVQGTSEMLARWIDAPYEEVSFVCAGINHLSWFIKCEWNGRDAIPLIRKAIRSSRKIYNQEHVRNEMFLALGYYVTESSGHNSEYNWWFRKRPDLIKKYCTRGTNWNPGKYAFVVERYTKRKKVWRSNAEKWITDREPLNLERGNEYAASIISATLGGEPFRFNGNVSNTGLVTNLPENCCVEVPVYVDKNGLSPVHVGALPPQCAVLTGLQAQVEDMAVEAALTGDRELAYQAIAHDPLTASVLSLAEIRKMVDAMFKKNRKHLPQFFKKS